LALLSVPLRWKRIIAAGTILALIFFAVRSLPFTFGVHTAIGIFLLVIAINKATNIPVVRSFIAVFASFITLALLELVIMEIFFAVTKLDPNVVFTGNNPLWKLLGLPQSLLLIFFALLISKFKKPKEDAWKI
jgi:hypothetical protein